MKLVICALAVCLFSLSSAAQADTNSADSTRSEISTLLAAAADSAGERFQLSGRQVTAKKCCKVCTKGKPCGDTCIAQDKVCHVGPGCAC